MNASDTIRERRSIRKFQARPVSREMIVSLLNEAANLYDADGIPHWRCIYYGTPEARRRLAESMVARMKQSGIGKLLPAKLIDMATKRATDTPALLVFVAKSADNQRQSDENYAAVCSIMQSFQLLSWEQGLGMLWYTEPMIMGEAFFKEINLQEGERVAGILNVGYFDKTPRRGRRTPAEHKWTVIGGGDRSHSDHPQVPAQSILEMLNDAVWAPNDGLREPWRFIYVTDSEAASQLHASYTEASSTDASPTYLLFVAKEEADPHKQEEDYAAVCCVIQNFQLLAGSKPWRVRRMIPEWIYDQERCRPFGIRPQERIVAVLELGGDDRRANSPSAPLVLDITSL